MPAGTRHTEIPGRRRGIPARPTRRTVPPRCVPGSRSWSRSKASSSAAPEALRAKYRASDQRRDDGRPGENPARPEACPIPLNATAVVLKRLAVRYRPSTRKWQSSMPNSTRSSPSTPRCSATCTGVGTDVASQLLVTVGDNPGRITTEAQIRRPHRSRANTGIVRENDTAPAQPGRRPAGQQSHPQRRPGPDENDTRTINYVARRRQEGKSTKEIIRCLKRYIAREIYDQLLHPQPAPDAGALRALRKTKNITLQAAADSTPRLAHRSVPARTGAHPQRRLLPPLQRLAHRTLTPIGASF